MSTKEYPLDYIQALHLLTGEEPKILEDDTRDTYERRGVNIFTTYKDGGWHNLTFVDFLESRREYSYRIYEPPAPEKLEPVELCDELKEQVLSCNHDAFGLAIAQAIRMAREEREAEKKGGK